MELRHCEVQVVIRNSSQCLFLIYNLPAMTRRSHALHTDPQRLVSNSSLNIVLLATCLIVALASATARATPVQPSSGASNVPGVYTPTADPKAVVIHGNVRFSVLTAQLIRMEWGADGKFEDHASLVFLNRRLPVSKFTANKTTHRNLTIKTDALELNYHPAPSSNGKFTSGNLEIKFTLKGRPVVWHPGMPDTGNLMGTTRTLDGALGDKTEEPIEPGLISRDGWIVVDDSTRPLFDSADFSFVGGESSPWPWLMQRPAGDRQDWYFFGYGHDYKLALSDYTKVAGRIPLPPRFAFGAWWSRYSAYSDQELGDLVHGFRNNDVPLDVLVIDMDWHLTFGSFGIGKSSLDQSRHTKGWSGYSWNTLLFPDPQQFLQNIHDEGLKTTLNLHPASGVQPWEDAYPAMARAMGIDPATNKYVPFDITNQKFATNYMNLLHHPLEKEGIDFWWLDWQQEANTQTPGVNPTWWLNYVHFTDQLREGKRPLLFHRWGGLGNHRYQIGFSGDTISVWESLAFQPWFTATAANVGYAYWSHDIGGHMPGVVDPELYTRWLQFGAFSPILRTHTTKNPDSERRIWAYPEPYSDIMRGSYHLRYALLPYIYTEARRTYDTGVAFLHPLYYDWPEADEAYTNKNEYVFGKQMMVDPVVAPGDRITGLANESVWLPPGEWIEWQTGVPFTGPVTVKRNFSIRQTPVYVRAGAIVPQAPSMQYSNQKPLDPLVLSVFPLQDGQSSTYTLYEDAGDSRAYQDNEAAWTELSSSENGSALTVVIAASKGSYKGMPTARAYEVRLPGDWPPATVTVNGRALSYSPREGVAGWRFEGNTLTTIITVRKTSVALPVTIRVTRSTERFARRAELNGFAGAMTRLREAYDALNQTWPITWSPDELIDAMQTGDRLTYRPEQAGEQLTHYRTALPRAIAKELARSPSRKDIETLAQRFHVDPNSAEAQKKGADYRERVARSLAALADVPNPPL
jgi:alpha-glucosidase (family GH31 glycosyl hydrolase)